MNRFVLVLVLVLAPRARASNPRLSVGLDEHVGARVPLELRFLDTTGRRVVLGELFDGHRPVLLVLAYARCTMLCSVVLHGVAEAVRATRAVPGRDYLPVVVSLDSSETPDEGASRQDHLLVDIGRAGDRAAWPYLVGDRVSIAALADALGFRFAWDPRTQQYAHPAVVFVLAPDGRIVEYLRGVRFDGLDAALGRARRGITTSDVVRDVITCFHFDPALRLYEARIQLVFRIGAGAVLAALVGLVIALLRWERRRKEAR